MTSKYRIINTLKTHSSHWIEQYTAASQKARQTSLNSLLQYMETQQVKTLTPLTVKAWIRSLMEKNTLKHSTIRGYLENLSSFFRYLQTHSSLGFVHPSWSDCMSDEPHSSHTVKPPLQKLQTHLLVALSLSYKLTSSELSNLTFSNLKFKSNHRCEIILPTNRNSYEVIPLAPSIANMMVTFLQSRGNLIPSSHIFIDPKTIAQMDSESIQAMLKNTYVTIVANTLANSTITNVKFHRFILHTVGASTQDLHTILKNVA